MRKREIRLILTLLVLIISTIAAFRPQWLEDTAKVAPQNFQPGYYQVSEFADGDTISVDMNGTEERVRFIGVDTPETHNPNKPVQCFGTAASGYTKRLIGDKPVRLEADPTNMNRDRYDRLLRYVYLPDGTLVNAKIIQDGYGFAYTYFPFEKLEEFRILQQQAREDNRGLWSNCPISTSNNGQQSTAPNR